MRSVSSTALRAMLAQETDEVFLVCLTIDHSSFDDPILVVNDMQPLVRAAGTFEPFAFDITLPSETEDQVPQVQLTIDNVDRLIVEKIRLISAERPHVRMEVVLASSPDVVEAGPFDFAILSATYNANVVTAVMGFEDDLLNTAFPGDLYTPSNSPGLF